MDERPSLGQKLQKLLAKNYGQGNGEESEQLKKERKVMEVFYEEIKKGIVSDIESGMPSRPIRISASGQHHDIFWILNMPQRKPVALDRQDNVFRDLWDSFLRWLTDNDLKVELYYRKDIKVVHDYWFEIRVSPEVEE